MPAVFSSEYMCSIHVFPKTKMNQLDLLNLRSTASEKGTLNASDSRMKSAAFFSELQTRSELADHCASEGDRASVARDHAIERAEVGAGEVWLAAAVAAVMRVALTHSVLTSDDCRNELADDSREPRAWGGVMKRAAKLGIIARTERFVTTHRVASHKRPMQLWESCVFGGAK